MQGYRRKMLKYSSALRQLLPGLLILLSLASFPSLTLAGNVSETGIININKGDTLQIHSSSPITSDFLISGGNVSDVETSRNATDIILVFKSWGEYTATLSFSLTGENSSCKIFIMRLTPGKLETPQLLNSFLISGVITLTLVLKIRVHERMLEWYGGLPSLQYFSWVPASLRQPIKMMIFFIPLAYFGGYMLLELSDRALALKRKRILRTAIKQSLRSIAKYGAIIGLVLIWIFVVFFF
jgi:hypothetical protein